MRTDLAICQMPMSMPLVSSPSQPGRTSVEVAEQGEHEHLDERVDRDEDRGDLTVAAGEVDPDQHHGDARCEADDDDAGPVGGEVGQHQPCEREHQCGTDEPNDQQRHDHRAFVGDCGADGSVAHLGEHREHHGEQADRDRQRHGVDLHLLQLIVEIGEGAPQNDAGEHRRADPHRE